MSIDERFDTGTSDIASLGQDVDSTYDCNTCGARCALANLQKHHAWHLAHEE